MKSREELEKIFERVAKQFSFEDAHLELANDKRMDALIDFATNIFIPDEPLSKSLGLTRDEEVVAILRYFFRENISILLVSDSTDEVIAIRASNVSKRDDSLQMKEIKSEETKTILKFLSHKDEQLNVFDKYGVDHVVHMMMLGVDRRFRNRGIATKLMKAAILFYSEIGFDPVVLKGEGTSNFSKAIYEKCGFEILHEFVYEDYKINDEVVFKNTGIHKSAKIYAKKI